MIGKQLFGVGLGLVIIAGGVTGAVALADGPQKAHIGPIELKDGTNIEAWDASDMQEVGQIQADSISLNYSVSTEVEALGATNPGTTPSNSTAPVDDSQVDTECVCTFSVVEGEVSALSSEDGVVTVMGYASGDVKTGQIRVQFPDDCICPCMLNDGQGFPFPEAKPTDTPCPEAAPVYPNVTPLNLG
ncbi:MAG: hypothetical protein PHV74_06835 [Dehalococcoidia bacterium]|nr:hypothetical protein [Dehalococcoidia bacterium]